MYPCFPHHLRYHETYEYYKKAQASYWTVEEVDLSQDQRDWDRLTAEERHFISYVLAFFASSDGIVLENLAARFMQGTHLMRKFKGFDVHPSTHFLRCFDVQKMYTL